MEQIVEWWKSLWTDQRVPAAALAGFISAFIIFIIKDALWQSRFTKVQKRKDFQEKQLQEFYAPLYQFYCQAYARFNVWRKNNPESKLDPQPFFQSQDDEEYVEKLFDEHPGYASPTMIRLWAEFKAVDDKVERNKRRLLFLTALIKEYNTLRKKLKFEYDKDELKTGQFS